MYCQQNYLTHNLLVPSQEVDRVARIAYHTETERAGNENEYQFREIYHTVRQGGLIKTALASFHTTPRIK